MSGIAPTGRPLPARLQANRRAEARSAPTQPVALRAIASRLIPDRSIPSRSIANPLSAHHVIAPVANRLLTNPLQTSQLMDGAFTPDRSPAAGQRPGLTLAVWLGTGQHRAAGWLVDLSRGVQP